MKKTHGILIGSDARQEWLLPWWWENYQRSNQYPVSCVDFGLSKRARAWCEERIELISLSINPLFLKNREEIDQIFITEWEDRYPNGFWHSRESWFKKAEACLRSPYEKTIWMDVDCEVVGSLEFLFQIPGIALAKDPIVSNSQYPIYNSGVIVFEKRHPLLFQWAKLSLEKNGFFRGDQDLLSQIIETEKHPIFELSPIYNWSVGEKEREDVVIYHWLGDAAKTVLRNKLMVSLSF